MVEYNYDAWGRHTVSGNNVALGNKNPFRYRGYYYDTETELYYLQSRYYDPKLCRFINMDSIEYAEPERINGLNLFAYCNNNPLKYNNFLGLSYSFSSSNSLSNFHSIVNSENNNDSYNIKQVGKTSGTSGLNSFFSANFVNMHHISYSIHNNNIVNTLLGNVSYKITTQINKPKMFYAYSNIGNSGTSYGVGVNLGNWFGVSAGVSDNLGIGVTVQLTPWFSASSEISLKDGITLGIGIINEDTTHEVALSIGWGTIVGMGLMLIPGARLFGIAVATISLLF